MNTDWTTEDLIRELDHPFDVKTEQGDYSSRQYTFIDTHQDDTEFLRFYAYGLNGTIAIEVPIRGGQAPFDWTNWTEIGRVTPAYAPIEVAVGLLRGYLAAYNDHTAGVTP